MKTTGFDSTKIRIRYNQTKIDELLRKYRSLKKYMKSSLYEIRKMDGTETIISDLLKNNDK